MMFKTFRQQLLWNFSGIILLFGVISIFGLVTFLRFFNDMDDLIRRPAITAELSTRLNDTHQLLANFVNYQDNRFKSLFTESVDQLVFFSRLLDEDIMDAARTMGNMNLYYVFLHIQEQILMYRAEGQVIVEMDSYNIERFRVFERLYAVRDRKTVITDMLSNLVFRQMVYIERYYQGYREQLQQQFMLLALAYSLIAILCVWFMNYQAKYLSRPIQHLIKQGEQIAQQNFDITKSERVSNQEILRLNRSFETMAEKIKESVRVLSEKNELEKKNLIMESNLRQASLNLLQSQINPHFLFNTLNTIRSMAQIEGAEKTEEILSSFAKFLRFNLKNMSSTVLLEQEVEFVENYLYLQKKRFGNRLTYTINFDSSLSKRTVPSLIIQPFVENSIIHGIEPIKTGGHISVMVSKKTEDSINVHIKDSGQGIPQQKLHQIRDHYQKGDWEQDHLGLGNTLSRIKLTSPGSEFEIDSSSAGTEVLLTIR